MVTNIIRRCWWVVLLIAMLSGCGPTLQETETQLQKARQYWQTIEGTGAGSIVSSDAETAENQLQKANNFFILHRLQEAYTAAVTSIQASERVLLENLKKNLIDTRVKYETIRQEKDLAAPVEDVLNTIDAMLAQVEQVQQSLQRGQSSPDTLILISDYQKRLDTIDKIYSQEVLRSDVSFGSGKYQLSVEGEAALLAIVRGIIEKAQALRDDNIAAVTIIANVYGYTDEMPIRTKALIQKLLEGVTAVPASNTEAYQPFLNQRLSLFRANSVAARLEQFFANGLPRDDAITFQCEHVEGKGEELPSGVIAKGIDDPLRRICNIHFYVKGKMTLAEGITP